MSDDSEEKKHKPSAKKLLRAREEGNVPHATDVLALAVWPVLFWLVFNWPSIESQLRRLVIFAVTTDYTISLEEIVNVLARDISDHALGIVLPLVAIAVIVSLIFGILDNGGVIFAVKPVSPDFNRLNPVEGLKRIFSMRTAAESSFNLIKIALFFGVMILILLLSVSSLQTYQACGMPCMFDALSLVLFPMLTLFIGIFVVSAILNFLMSRALFVEEQKMSETEMKRDNKETYGDPQIKNRRKAISQTMATGPGRLGLAGSTFMITGDAILIGLRYVEKEAPAPFVVLKATGDRADELMPSVHFSGKPVVENRKLAQLLLTKGTIGQIIPQDSFTDVAAEIINLERGGVRV